eukprot:CAMPEP_0175931590 /NCGR_PEP_ID=MMETSP0108-20121206/18930_1 /TAXON_ID=195067 ORGANISM="Goniomonas pacifica, Strain CCMP1869" /NCGR_SAMPLE_ID=MMETSP0108 /ASSEMBLY_ACC=CAM_ASM_000204 /LENGTH=366 /DNA_ID=CAMNT_0017255157 /DNA_START=84 /DNA_END=1184 /DNA_ORIENTATION=-
MPKPEVNGFWEARVVSTENHGPIPRYEGTTLPMRINRIGPTKSALPFETQIRGEFVRPTFLETEVVWYDGLSYVVGVDNPQNIYHVSFSVADAIAYQDPGPYDGKYRNQLVKRAMLWHSGTTVGDWMKGILKILFDPHVEVIDMYTLMKDQGTQGKPLCFRRAVMPGINYAFFQGVEHALAFRQRVERFYGVVSTMISTDPNKPPKLLYVRRRGVSRQVLNEEDMLESLGDVANRVGLILESPSMESRSFLSQVQLAATAAVMVAPHGAGMSNMIFMPIGATVIELTPAKIVSSLFNKIAAMSGLLHHWLMSPVEMTAFAPAMQERYHTWSTRTCMQYEDCLLSGLLSNFSVETTQLTRLLMEVVY